MSEFFLNIVNMSISASWIVLAVIVLRMLFKKAPKWITVLLWSVVAVRLICPFSFESVMSLIPSAQTISPDIISGGAPAINSGVPAGNNAVNPVAGGSFVPDTFVSTTPLQTWIHVLSIVWLVGVAVVLLYAVISYLRLKRKISTAVLLSGNIFQTENVVSPFVFGVVKPKIYLPFKVNEQYIEHVVAHEKAHIRRKDHWWKPLGFIILSIHWFNPLIWLSYILFCRDIELACDEKVIKELKTEQRADYSQALLDCSVNRRMIAACPLAFGEVDVKERVKSVLNYRKPAFWIVAAAVIAIAVLAVCFLTNPTTKRDENKDSTTASEKLTVYGTTNQNILVDKKINFGSYNKPHKIGESVRLRHSDINTSGNPDSGSDPDKADIYDYNLTFEQVLTGTMAEQKLKESCSNFEEEKFLFEDNDVYLIRVNVKYNPESKISDRLPTDIYVSAVNSQGKYVAVENRLDDREYTDRTENGEVSNWYPVFVPKGESFESVFVIGDPMSYPGPVATVYYDISEKTGKTAALNSPTDENATDEISTSNAFEPVSNNDVLTFKAKVKEVYGNHYVVEKLNGDQVENNGESTGALYQFDYSSTKFSVDDIIVVEYKEPVQEIHPNGIINLVNVYLAKDTKI